MLRSLEPSSGQDTKLGEHLREVVVVPVTSRFAPACSGQREFPIRIEFISRSSILQSCVRGVTAPELGRRIRGLVRHLPELAQEHVLGAWRHTRIAAAWTG